MNLTKKLTKAEARTLEEGIESLLFRLGQRRAGESINAAEAREAEGVEYQLTFEPAKAAPTSKPTKSSKKPETPVGSDGKPMETVKE